MIDLCRRVCDGCTKNKAWCKARAHLENIESAADYWPQYIRDAVMWWIDLDCPSKVEDTND